jgi:hypothetical protein
MPPWAKIGLGKFHFTQELLVTDSGMSENDSFRFSKPA